MRLTRIGDTERRRYGVYVCVCGTKKEIFDSFVNTGRIRSCGCLRSQLTHERRFSHGDTASAEFRIWSGMRTRCYNRRCKAYPDYGGRGIIICERWRDYENFLADMGRRPSPKHTIERVDNNGNYCPENCEWVLKSEQSWNRRNIVYLTLNGERKSITAWARQLKVDYRVLHARRVAGWTDKQILTTPLNARRVVMN